MPKEIGVAQPWNFLCKRLKSKGSRLADSRLDLGDEQQAHNKRDFFEDSSHHAKRDCQALKVRNLRKVFANGKVAVDKTSMTLYSGQIFALLGHNGAGKTTTISMLTGLLEPTGGQAELNGIDIFKDLDYLRTNLGVCPQHNVLFPYLTVREHLELYATFKGIESVPLIRSRVDRLIYEVELVSE